MKALLICPVCTHRQTDADPTDYTYSATASARVTVTLDGRGEVLDYYDVELDEEQGYRDVRCEYCDAEVGDLSEVELSVSREYRKDRIGPALLRVHADVNMEAAPIATGRDAAAHTALIQAAEARGLVMHVAGDPTGAYVEGTITGYEDMVVPMLAALAAEGHSYTARISTKDEQVMDRAMERSGGAIASLEYDRIEDFEAH